MNSVYGEFMQENSNIKLQATYVVYSGRLTLSFYVAKNKKSNCNKVHTEQSQEAVAESQQVLSFYWLSEQV